VLSDRLKDKSGRNQPSGLAAAFPSNGKTSIIIRGTMHSKITLGLPQMYKEPGEKRDYLPTLTARMQKLGAQVILEHGYGAEMGFSEEDYLKLAPGLKFAPHKEIFRQDYVLVLRYPSDDEVRLMNPGACLISMLHYPTRPDRVEFLRAQGIEAISLDEIKDDNGRRLIENLRSVAWNGVEAAFKTLRAIYPDPGFDSPRRPSIKVTLLGAGAVGSHVVTAAIRYGNEQVRHQMFEIGAPGVMVRTVDYDLTSQEEFTRNLLADTDILVDATQRPDPRQPVIPNEWIGDMPQHAVLLDLSVDPYKCETEPFYVKGIEGIPQGNLDKYVFSPDDPAYDELPACIPNHNRRHAVSCYSWPGIYPKECMELYGKQLRPIMHVLIEKGGVESINPNGRFFERAIGRALLSRWAD
jgi:alanine dehydrogenase